MNDEVKEEISKEEVKENTSTKETSSVDNQKEVKNKKEPRHEHKHKINKERDELIKANLELKEKVLRISAEMQNMRRRYDLEKSDLIKYDGFDLVEKLLPIIDNFERALKIKTEGMEKHLEGFKMIYENLISILSSIGVTEVEVLGKTLDPNIMNAIVTEVNSEVPENTVLEVLQKGYIYNERLIRPAMVKVSIEKNLESESNE